jgi:dienelactone hydrolase
MTGQFEDYRDGDVILQAAVARPAGDGPAPAVLVAHAWAGRGEEEHAVAERLATLGYVGIAIDMFGKGVTGDPAGDNTHLIAPWLGDRAALLTRMRAAVSFARGLEGIDPARIAAIGYCFGGLCVLDLARGGADGLAGVVSLHGLLDGNELDVSGSINAKVLVEHGWRDPLAPPEKVVAFGDEMNARGADWQLHAHGKAMHAFSNPGANSPDNGMKYDADAARRSWAATTAFLAELFGSVE